MKIEIFLSAVKFHIDKTNQNYYNSNDTKSRGDSMRYYNLMDVKLQDISIFITVAEFLSVTKTADYLYLSPSKISKSIKKLEDLWGVILFIRDKNKLTLTPAGVHAYEGLGKVMRRIECVVDETVQAQRVKPLLRFGSHSLISSDRFIAPITDNFKDSFPNITFSVECRDNFGVLRKMLISDELDVIYTSEINLQPLPDYIAWKSLHKIPLYIVANKKHPLATRDHVTLKDIHTEQFIITSPTTDFHSDIAYTLCKQNGFTPNIYRYAPNIYSQLTEIYVHPDVVCIIPIMDLNIYLNEEHLAYWRIRDEFLNMGLAYKKDANQFVRGFIQCASEISKYVEQRSQR